MSVAIIDYGAGNLHSIAKAVECAVGSKNINVIITNDYQKIKNADRIILPGVGSFGDCMSGIKSSDGIIDSLNEIVIEKQRPFLGICVGMQLLAEQGLENGSHEGLGWIKGKVVKIQPENVNCKIPHMGWNELNLKSQHELLNGINSQDHVYFVHSYHMLCNNQEDIIATVNYGKCDITAVIAKNNIVATQFHPEKSQKIGLKLIENFIKL